MISAKISTPTSACYARRTSIRRIIVIRKAELKDAEQFCKVIHTSIIELCELDHKNDKIMLNRWLENKTLENCQKWIQDKTSTSLVFEKNNKVMGVAHIGHNGHLFLCYVLPEAKGQKMGHKLLIAAEKSITSLGVRLLTLESTLTAKFFYEDHGYKFVGKDSACLKYIKSVPKPKQSKGLV